jgi:arginase family enzyme
MGRRKTTFVTNAFTEDEANVIALGVDCPVSLRKVSRLVEPFDVTTRRNFLGNARIFDAGDLKMEELEARVRGIVDSRKLPLILAKEHTATLHAMKAAPSDTMLIVFDAHPDLKDEYEGSKFSHACWLRRLCEVIGCKRMMILGVRSTELEEIEFMENNGMRYATAEKIRKEANKVVAEVEDFAGGFNTYVSLDMDVFDPSIAPAVKYPIPGGITYSDFLRITKALEGSKLVGLDCVEIRPIGDNRITEFLAVKSLFRLLSGLET